MLFENEYEYCSVLQKLESADVSDKEKILHLLDLVDLAILHKRAGYLPAIQRLKEGIENGRITVARNQVKLS